MSSFRLRLAGASLSRRCAHPAISLRSVPGRVRATVDGLRAMPVKPAVVLFAVWAAHPARAVVGLLGVALFVWSLWPVADETEHGTASPVAEPTLFSPRLHRAFWIRAGSVWRTSRGRGTAAVAGAVLFVWSLWPVLMPG